MSSTSSSVERRSWSAPVGARASVTSSSRAFGSVTTREVYACSLEVVNTICAEPVSLVLLFGSTGPMLPEVVVAQIELEHLTTGFPGGPAAVEDVSLRVEDGEFMVLVGPSGCGKSTLLRMIAGLEEVTEGRISVGARDVTELAPRRRDVAMVFQSYALYPHMSVRQNI